MEQYNKTIIPFEKLRELTIPYNEPLILSVEKDGILFDFLIRLRKDSDKLIVLGSGAYDSNKFSPPVFQRHSWMNHFEESVIYFNDPTLYLGKMNLGWGFGNAERHFLEEVAEILKLLLNLINIENNNVLFYGSSAGGFMSMLLAGFIKGSRALVNNPQTFVNNYFASHVNKLFQAVVPEYSKDEILKEFSYRINALEFFKKINYIPEIYYLQNLACEHDMDKHLIPFFLGLKEVSESLANKRIQFDLYYDKEKDHNPLDMDETLSYIHKLIRK
ncbi:glycosyl transferase family 2 [Neobacillus sedimentimangrovi]|uniref:Glycosyl transferase family 2 n=2 Tax=Neobacillus TaxID=2675232 RepID=A0A6B3TV68_9BACI|nr:MULTISPECIES: glycosyl transferase family 2 [Neobacillus]MCD4838319.1 glycosyl transferase family 2 [Neobacillus sedimentimangrovi]NEX80249.1 glycosyl transferase family 2 [Neobacillus thermocopriae]